MYNFIFYKNPTTIWLVRSFVGLFVASAAVGLFAAPQPPSPPNATQLASANESNTQPTSVNCTYFSWSLKQHCCATGQENAAIKCPQEDKEEEENEKKSERQTLGTHVKSGNWKEALRIVWRPGDWCWKPDLKLKHWNKPRLLNLNNLSEYLVFSRRKERRREGAFDSGNNVVDLWLRITSSVWPELISSRRQCVGHTNEEKSWSLKVSPE